MHAEGDQQEMTRNDGEAERNQETLADALPHFVAVGLQIFGVGAELGSVSSVFGEVHRAAFDVFVFVSKRLGTGDQPGVYGFKRVPIIHDVILAGGFVNALMMSASSEPVDVGRCPSTAHSTVSAPRCTSSLSDLSRRFSRCPRAVVEWSSPNTVCERSAQGWRGVSPKAACLAEAAKLRRRKAIEGDCSPFHFLLPPQ
jgi:hypothetical protein